jgi:hypothetical protein
VLVREDLGVLVLRQLLEVGVGPPEQKVDEEAEQFLEESRIVKRSVQQPLQESRNGDS